MTNQIRFDIIVIGTGPAGAAAAYRLARDGFKTLILEKAKLPRYKACGGGVTPKVLRAVDFDIQPMIEDSITRAVLAYRHRPIVDLHFAEPVGWCVMRDKFDNYLTERAVDEGAHLHDGEAVKEIEVESNGVRVTTRAGEYTAEIVVGADGANGVTARAVNLHQPRDIAAALELELAVPDAQLDVWQHTFCLDFGAIPYGYVWIFPKADHLSVGIGTFVGGSLFRDFGKGAGGRSANLRALLNEWIEREPTLRNHRLLVERGHLLPLGGGRANPLHHSRVALAGDAGGLIDPLLGEGIYYALRSGQVAAEVIGEAFRSENLALADYTRRVHAEFLPEFQTAASLARFLYRFPQPTLQTLARFPPLRDYLNGMMDGDAGKDAFVWRAARTVGDWLDKI